jgi:hypothetical protein
VHELNVYVVVFVHQLTLHIHVGEIPRHFEGLNPRAGQKIGDNHPVADPVIPEGISLYGNLLNGLAVKVENHLLHHRSPYTLYLHILYKNCQENFQNEDFFQKAKIGDLA